MIATVLAAWALLQAGPEIGSVSFGEAPDQSWLVQGKSTFPDQMALSVTARRIDRRWDAKSGMFAEVLSNRFNRTAYTVVESRAFSATFPDEAIGMYVVSVSDEERQLAELRGSLGRASRLFSRSIAHVKKLAEAAEKAGDFLGEVEKFGASGRPVSESQANDFRLRIQKYAKYLKQFAEPETDLSATVQLLDRIYFELRNAQYVVAADGSDFGTIDDDDPGGKRAPFLTEDLTLEDLRRQIDAIKAVLSAEIEASVSTLLFDLYSRSQADAKLLLRAKEAAREAVKLVRAAPTSDELFIQFLEKADREELSVVLAGLQERIQKLVRK